MASPSTSKDRDSDSDSIIILDEEEGSSAPLPAPAPPAQEETPPACLGSTALPPRPPPQANGGSGQKKPGLGKDPTTLKAENERLFAEFVAFCSKHTVDHPEVIPYLAGRCQKTSPNFLASVEFHNVLCRCLTRVQARRSKIYVYIKELCTVFSAHSQKKKPSPVSSTAPAEAAATTSNPSEPAKPRAVAKRRIQDLENLLRVYAKEIRRLQERELDLAELDREDSAYLLESRLKRRMMHVFKHLCELKDCTCLTGRVIEKRIPYRGTRYPEINRRIARLINRPEAFPDYADILKVVQKASARHSLGLPKRQMESMAASVFQEVGNLLKERRHLDFIYNFGSHLTDKYQPNTDPALFDGELARHLQRNKVVSLQRLDEVMCRYTQLQDKTEEEEWRWRRCGGHPQAGPSGAPRQPRGEPPSPQKSAAAAAAAIQGSPGPKAGSKEEDEDEEGEEDEEEEEEESSELDVEAELEKCLGGEDAAPEDQEEEDEDSEDSEDDEGGEETEEGQLPLEEPCTADGLPAPAPRPALPRQFLLATEEAFSPEAGETPPPSPKPSPSPAPRIERGDAFPLSLPEQMPPAPVKRGRSLENEGSPGADVTALREVSGPPHSKRARQEHRVSNSCIEVPSTGSSEDDDGGEGGVLLSSLSPHSPAPVVDSTCTDSPGPGLVTSSQGSPLHPSHLLIQVCKTSVATQCDPEEIIILSDSD